MNLNYISKPPKPGKKGFFKRLSIRYNNRKYDRNDNKRQTQLKRVVSLIVVMILCVVYAQVTPTPSNRPSTKLNDVQNFGNLGKRVTLEQTEFSPTTGKMLIRLKVSTGGDDTKESKVNWEKISIDFNGQGWRMDNPRTTGKVIPISDDTVTVAFENVNPNFQVVELKVSDTQLDSSQMTVNKYDKDKKKEEDSPFASIIINRDAPKTEIIEAVPSQNELATEQMERKILASKDLIDHAEDKNKQIDKEIADTKNSIKELQTERKFLSDGGQQTMDSQIQELNKSITSMNDNKAANKEIMDEEHEKIELYQTNIVNISKGNAVLGKVQEY